MAFRLRWTSSAADDFEDIAQKIELDSDIVESRQIARSIYRSIEGLCEYPHIGEAMEDFPGLRRRVKSGFKIIYQVFEAEQVVEIVRILHQRQEASLHLDRE